MFVYLIAYLSPLTSSIHMSGSGWCIFLKSSGDIPVMFAQQFQVITIFVCLIVNLSSLTLYIHISGSVSYIFLISFGVLSHYKFLVCLSLCLLAYNLTEIRPIVIIQVKMNKVLFMSVRLFDGFLLFDIRPTY